MSFPCDQCGICFEEESNYQQHIDRVHILIQPNLGKTRVTIENIITRLTDEPLYLDEIIPIFQYEGDYIAYLSDIVKKHKLDIEVKIKMKTKRERV